MNRRFQILIGIISILVFGFFIKFIFTNEFKRTITVLDCAGIYYQKLFEKPESGYLEIGDSNAKVDVANCLCEKYLKSKNRIYEKEILKLYNEPFGSIRLIIKNPSKNIDTICKYRKEVFTKKSNIYSAYAPWLAPCFRV